MTSFNIDSISDLPDRIYIEVDHRFNVAIIRTETGMDLRVYPWPTHGNYSTPVFCDCLAALLLEGSMALPGSLTS